MINLDLAHTEYLLLSSEWEKYRYIMNGGDEFIEQYLVQFSSREDSDEFTKRKTLGITPSAEFARAALIDVKNSIFQRMSDISRKGGTLDYQEAIKGINGGVDQRGSTMNHFIGQKVLQELLFLGKLGVYVDMPRLNSNLLSLQRSKKPYFYTYTAEDILNWEVSYQDNVMEFTQLLLKDNYYDTNIIGLPSQLTYRYRLLEKIPEGVRVTFYSRAKFEPEKKNDFNLEPDEEFILDVPRIPFVLFELDQPLTRSIANHQIALMNMESSDVCYALKANYPFYTEQSSAIQSGYLKSEENSSEGAVIQVGGTTGRRYAPGMDRPDYIHPSSEPLTASMEKQKNLKDDIRLLINLALSNVKSKYASAESKEMDERGLESGLSALGLILEQGERELATIFSSYENSREIATISYPTKYSLKTDLQKLSEVEKLADQKDRIPSNLCRKVIAKKMAEILIGTDVSSDDLQTIFMEIDNATYSTGNVDDISSDLEHGVVSLETAAMARGYDSNEIEQAKKDHAERIARIAASQGAGARGIDNDESGELEKEQSQNADLDENGRKRVRGEE